VRLYGVRCRLASGTATGKVASGQQGGRKVRILVLGAGAIGGYFGGRLVAGGVDISFLVRPKRAEQLARDGLRVKSPLGDVALPVKTVLREQVGAGYDAILLSCKSYDLDDAIEAIRPAVPGAVIIPLLNGMLHLDRLDAAFGRGAVGGGVAGRRVVFGWLRFLADPLALLRGFFAGCGASGCPEDARGAESFDIGMPVRVSGGNRNNAERPALLQSDTGR